MSAQFLYLGSDGQMKGPLWLSQIRELFHSGRISRSTEVCDLQEKVWLPLEQFPEIVEDRETARDFLMSESSQQFRIGRSDTKRLVAWLVVLLFAYATYVLVNWNR
ncbi:MAG: DUF4339 domain-containing protein [Verrucomicrobiales bacterium]|nr:DUF4339 domain-containing protein [Verrucomicrobiales bacterium]